MFVLVDIVVFQIDVVFRFLLTMGILIWHITDHAEIGTACSVPIAADVMS